MKLLLRVLAGLLALAAILGLTQLAASESGEVVVLTTRDAAGEAHETRLWVVDHEGGAWLRAGADVQAWYQRLASSPAIEVERNGERSPYTAVPAPEKRELINGLMLDKYGWADRYIGVMFGRDAAIPIRLEPRSR